MKSKDVSDRFGLKRNVLIRSTLARLWSVFFLAAEAIQGAHGIHPTRPNLFLLCQTLASKDV